MSQLNVLPARLLEAVAQLVAHRRNLWLAAERGTLRADDEDMAHAERDRLDAVRTHWAVLVAVAESVEQAAAGAALLVDDALRKTWVEARQRLRAGPGTPLTARTAKVRTR